MKAAAAPLAGSVLVVDDEPNICRALRMVLEGEGAVVMSVGSAEAALELLRGEDDLRFDAVIMDVLLPGMSGLDLLAALRDPVQGTLPVPFIMISGHASVADAVLATRLGAFDFLEKPLERDRLIVSVRNALRHAAEHRELIELRQQIRGEIIGRSEAVTSLLRQIEKVATTQARVLIIGESGTGKELVARAIHEASELRTRPFVKVNCAAIAPHLIESELFGHEKGAFTGATAQKRGLFELADGGTLLLDEIGDMELAAQAKVLRVLQSGELMRVGGNAPIQVRVRVLAATHRNLQEAVAAGTFREDLFFRLNVVPVRVPPLRERRDDIELLCRAFIDASCRENGFRGKRLAPAALTMLRDYSWPGNVRELRNVIERMVILSEGDLGPDDVPDEMRGLADAPTAALPTLDWNPDELPPGVSLKAFREAVERTFITARLSELGWNVSRAAESLGIERTHLHKKMRALGIVRGHP